VMLAFISMGSCTNDEGNSDIDVITPSDSTQGSTEIIDLSS
jgi:hypothetical protein